jgi:hypothetical protein
MDKPYRQMTTEELQCARSAWEDRVESASGWPSAHFAAKQVAEIVAEAKRRGLDWDNKYPIMIG